jgi:formylmethanofuran dehydrogenase subunit B
VSEVETVKAEQGKVRCTNVTCTVCGMSCDDIEVVMANDEITTKNACMVGDARFQGLLSTDRIIYPVVYGEKEEWARAIEKAADILLKAKRPLIFLGGETSTEAMAVGVEIAELLGGLVDGNSSICHGPSIMGLQNVGLVSCTLGECRNRADLAIYWGCNPADSHPRHMSKHSMYTRGFFIEQGSQGRKIIVVDPRRSPTAALADLHVKPKPGSDYELLDALMVALRGEEYTKAVEDFTGVSAETIGSIVRMIKECKFGVLWLGLGIAGTQGKNHNSAIAMRLVQLCNDHTKFVVLANRVECNDAGLNQVLAWTTGFPFAVDFSRGYPRYQPGEYSCVDAICRGEVDAVLSICADLGSRLPKKAVERMMDVPVVSLEVSPGPQSFVSDVILPGVLDGIECEGTFYRMDNVPIRARSFTRPPFDHTKSNEDTLKKLLKVLKQKKEDMEKR